MATRITRTITLDLCERGDDHALGSITLRLTCDVTLGTPESGLYGAPENYDPGDGGEVVLATADILDSSGLLENADARGAAQAWLEWQEDTIMTAAAERVADDWADAAERAGDERRDELRGAA